MEINPYDPPDIPPRRKKSKIEIDWFDFTIVMVPIVGIPAGYTLILWILDL